MEEVSLTEAESRYFSDLFLCCDVEKTGKIPMLKATDLFSSANLPNDILLEIISLAGIPSTALHISRVQFYSCLKLIAAHQASMPLRLELVSASVQLPLPRFSWKDSTNIIDTAAATISSSMHSQVNNSLCGIPPPPTTDRKNSLTRRPSDWQENVGVGATNSRRNSAVHQQQPQLEAAINSDVQSTDSEVEQNESSCGGGGGVGGDVAADGSGGSGGRDGHHHRQQHHQHHRRHDQNGSPEAWSTNSDSPTPTNSVVERPWVQETLWQGLLGDEHRQLLGTEEESSDRHSSDDDENESFMETIYQITPEQREYYFKQFKAVQHDPNGLLSGQVARVFFEKSRIPVEELRHIWQLCDVTRDGALSLYEFTAAMHLVVLRRNNIPLPAVLPTCLYPSVLQYGTLQMPAQEPPEADLLHLNDDDEDDNTDNTVVGTNVSVPSTVTAAAIAPPVITTREKNIMNLSSISTSSQKSNNSRQGITANANQSSITPPQSQTLPHPQAKNNSISNSPNVESGSTPPNLPTAAVIKPKDRNVWELPSTQWTKFTESPTSNVSSPGPKPVNFDMLRTAQAVVSDPQILHPVPLRVTPIGGSAAATTIAAPSEQRDTSPKQVTAAVVPSAVTGAANTQQSHHRESLQSNDLRAIQRPQAKKVLTKSIGALPPPPQREPNIGSGVGNTSATAAGCESGDASNIHHISQQQQPMISKKDPPPLPPPRPHRHGRSSSLDLNKFKITTQNSQQPEIIAQASFYLQTSAGFADFTHFPEGNTCEQIPEKQQYQQHSLTSPLPLLPPTRLSLQSPEHVSAFEKYRKPNTSCNSQSPPPAQQAHHHHHHTQPTEPPPPLPPYGNKIQQQQPQQQTHAVVTTTAVPAAASASAGAPLRSNTELYDKHMIALNESLRHVSFKEDNNMADVLRHLREQNSLLLRLCNDLCDELLTVQTRKEEIRIKLESAAVAMEAAIANNNAATMTASAIVARTGSSISAPVTANVTGGSGSSGGVQSNV